VRKGADPADGAPTTIGRDRRERILTSYPYPIARAYARVVSEQDVAARYGALLDTFEILLRFLVFTLLSRYRSVAGLDANRDRILAELIRKRGLSTGDWSKMLLTCAAVFRDREDPILSGLSAILFDAQGKPRPRTAWIAELTQARNRHWGHRIGRTADFYDQRIKVDLPDLERALEAMGILSELRLIVPTRLSGSMVTEGIIYTGLEHASGVALALSLSPDEAAPEVQALGSVLLQRAGDRFVSVFPFLRYREALGEVQRGLYFLEDWEWVRRKDRPELKAVTYLPENPAAPAETDRKFAPHVERALFGLLPAARQMLVDSIGSLPVEDHDWEIPSVWAEREIALRTVVGRTSLRDRIRDLVVQSDDGRLLVLKGAPGMGKSSFLYMMHEALRERGALLHSVRCNPSPESFLRALIHQCGQLLGQPLGDAAYAGERIEDLRTSLEQRMLEVARARGSCVALIDALDELRVTDDHWGAAMTWLPRALPAGVFVVVTCRPHTSLLRTLRASVSPSQMVEWELDPLVQSDLSDFAGRYLGKAAAEAHRVVDLAAAFARVGGHPLYLRILLESVGTELRSAAAERRRPRRIDARRLESDQARQMESVWEVISGRHANLDAARCARRQLLMEYLAVARLPGLSTPLCRRLIERAEGAPLAPSEVTDLLESISAWLREPVIGRLLPFHLTLTDYVLQRLGDDARCARHRELADALMEEGARLDHEYWRTNVADHAVEGRMPVRQRARLVADDSLLLARLDEREGAGAVHGAFLARHLEDEDPKEGAVLVDRFVRRWASDGARVRALPFGVREQLAELFKAAPLPGFGEQARRIYEQLHEETGDHEYLLRKAWVCYQILDEWRDARSCLSTCIESLESAGATLEAARAQRLLAGIVFDAGDDSSDPEAMLRTRCLPAFADTSCEHERAHTWETLGVVIDAEARWEEALVYYAEAEAIHGARRSGADLGRVRLNRSIAFMFTEGLHAAIAEIEKVSGMIDAPGASQIARYYRANRCLMALLDGSLEDFDELHGTLKPEEHWVTLTARESLAVRHWFGGEPDRAMMEMEALIGEFEALDDAWGRIDNVINIGFVLLSLGRIDEARARLGEGFERSEEQGYPIGRAMAKEGLRRIGSAVATGADDAFYRRHLKRLFERCPSPFVPCYLLLMP